MEIYEPAEDSYLLQKQIRNYALGRVLDMGTGSGIQALEAMGCPNVREVVAVDINPQVVVELNKEIKEKHYRKIKAVKSDLFENVEGKYHLIIFNPPYLPQDQGIEDWALYGGEKGWELSERFFHKTADYLLAEGVILFLFSTLTDKKKIDEIITRQLFEFKQIDSEKLAFEELFVYEIKKGKLLRELEAHNIENLNYFAQGKRGVIYTGTQDKSRFIKTHFAKKELVKVAVKIRRVDSKAEGRIENEAKWLKKLNKLGIGPRLLFSAEDYLVYEFVEGEFILDWLKRKNKGEVFSVILNVLKQCRELDKLNVNKEEMHHPQKHILIGDKVTMLDFERCNETDKPKNVTQFVEFLSRIIGDLQCIKWDVNVLRDLSREYKDTYAEESFQGILSYLSKVIESN